MFTGIITAIGEVRSIVKSGDWQFEIAAPFDCSSLVLGASVACSGVCLTVVKTTSSSFYVDVSAETLARTTLSSWQVGTNINLEPALKVGDELGGHIVSGHVDGLAVITEIEALGDSHKLTISVDDRLKAFIAEKGSVALDGISLTVNQVVDNQFTINVIAHSWTHTTLGVRHKGDNLNLEIDTLARYLARMLDVRFEQENR